MGGARILSCTAVDSHKCTLAYDLFTAVWNVYDDSEWDSQLKTEE